MNSDTHMTLNKLLIQSLSQSIIILGMILLLHYGSNICYHLFAIDLSLLLSCKNIAFDLLHSFPQSAHCIG